MKSPWISRWLVVLLALPLTMAPALLHGTPTGLAARAKTLDGLATLKSGTSMGLMPADVAFYYSSLRLKEQFDWLMQTKAVAKIKDLPMVKEGLAALEDQFKNSPDFSPIRRFLNVKENQELVTLGLGMISEEIFIAGGKNTQAFLELAGTAFAAVQFAPLAALAEMKFDEQSQNKARVRALLDTLSEAADEEGLKIPDLLLGFKVKDKEQAKAQLKRLENLVMFAAGQVPELKDRLKRGEQAGGDFLVLTLDGGMIPWKEIDLKEFEEDPGDYDDLVEHLKKMKLTLSLGIKGDYVLLAVGESMAFIDSMGKGTSLAEHPEVKPLLAHAGKKLTSLSYTSKSLRMMSAYDPAEMHDLVDTLVESAGEFPFLELPEEKVQKLAKDLKEMFSDLAPFQTQPGAVVGCSFISERGQESFSYDYSKYPTADASKPLQLIQHLGGDPILAYVGRTKMGAESWANFAKWTAIGYKHFDELVAPKLPEEVQEKYKEVMAWAGPLFVKLEVTTRTKLLPALADQSGGFVLDAKLKSKQWFAEMPEAEEPLPAPELAFLWGVTDAELLKTAMGEYRATANEFLKKGVELAGGMVPELSIPEPQTQPFSGGAAYFYPLPEELDAVGLDKQVQPAAGLSAKLATFAFSLKHNERLHAATPLPYASSLPMDLKRPASSFFVFDFLALHEAAKPWIGYAVKQAEEDMGEADKAKLKEYLPQVRTIIDCTKILRRSVSLSYQENGLWVTHGFTEVKDID